MTTSFDDLFSQVEKKRKKEPSGSFDELFEQVSGKQPSRAKSLVSAPIKGLIKGAAKFSPLPSFGPVPTELGERITEQVLPTQQKGLEDILEFTGENIPLAALGEGGLAKRGLQALTGGLAKQQAKELELPEWAQEIVGTAGMLGPDIAKSLGSKALRPSSKQKNAVDFLRSKGLSDEEITPLIQNKRKLAFLSKGASKFEKTDPRIENIQNKLGNVFEGIREKGEGKFLQGTNLSNFEKEFYDKFSKIDEDFQDLIKTRVEKLFNTPIDFKSLHDFERAINRRIKGVEGGKAVLGILKEPVQKAQSKIDKELFSELQKTKGAYRDLKKFSEKMTKKDFDALLNLGQAGTGLYGVLTLDPSIMTAAGLTGIGRYGVRQLLSNPRFQNIHLKIWETFLKGKIPQALKLMNTLDKMLSKRLVSVGEESATKQE